MEIDQKHSRRRFLSGSAAVPVILTVQSGAALAKTSSACQVRDNAFQPDPTLALNQSSTAAPSPDQWLRQNVRLLNLTVNNVVLKDAQNTPIIFFRDKEGLDATAYYKYTGAVTAPQRLTTPVPGSGVGETEVGIKAFLVQVDQNGAKTGFYSEAGVTGQKITTSCWTSFK